MLNKLREKLKFKLQQIGKKFASTGLSANFWTIIGLVFAFASGIVYGIHLQYSVIIGGILLLISGFFDIVDGQVARITNTKSKIGAFLDSVFDKIAEVAIFLGILIGGYGVDGYLVLLAITLSLLVSYTRARAESLGVQLQGIGIGERAERLLIIAIIGMVRMDYAIIVVVIIAGITLIQRIINTYRNM